MKSFIKGKETSSFKFFPKEAVMVKELSYIPDQVRLEILADNQEKILPEEVKQIKDEVDAFISKAKNVENPENIYISKKIFPKESTNRNSYIKLDQKYYAVIKEVLGKGAFGKVVIARDIDSGKIFALKKQEIKENLPTLKKEHEILVDLDRSPKATVRKRSSKELSTEHYYILMELAKGSPLDELVAEEESRDPEQTFLSQPLISPLIRVQLAIKLIEADKKLLDRDYLHLDMKAANVMAQLVNQTITLIDFGYTAKMNSDREVALNYIKGSPVHLALEIRALTSQKPASAEVKQENAQAPTAKRTGGLQAIYNEKTEVYALGMTLAELVSIIDMDEYRSLRRRPPSEWGDTTFVEKIAGEITKEKTPYVFNNACMPKDALLAMVHLIYNMTEKDVNKRFNMQQSLDELNRIKQIYFSEAKVKVGVLDVAKYLTISSPDEKRKLLQQLLPPFTEMINHKEKNGSNWQEKIIDEILLIYSSGQDRSDYIYLQVKREIEEEILNIVPDQFFRLAIADTVVVGRDVQAIQDKVNEYLKKRELPTECIFGFPELQLETKQGMTRSLSAEKNK